MTEPDTEWRPVDGGTMTDVWTDGRRIRRPLRPWSPAVHQLLGRIEERDVPEVPRLLQVTRTHEILTRLPGQSVQRPWPEPLQSIDWLAQVGRWLRQLHDALRGFQLDAETMFVWGPREPAPDHVVNHGDLGPWNMLVDEGVFSGVIDWDLARFGAPVDDLAEVAFELGPLRENRNMLADPANEERVLARVEALCDGYGGVSSGRVLDRVVPMFEGRIDEMNRLAENGDAPFGELVDRGTVEALRRDLDFARRRYSRLK